MSVSTIGSRAGVASDFAFPSASDELPVAEDFSQQCHLGPEWVGLCEQWLIGERVPVTHGGRDVRTAHHQAVVEVIGDRVLIAGAEGGGHVAREGRRQDGVADAQLERHEAAQAIRRSEHF